MKKLFKVLGILISIIVLILIAGLIYFNLHYPDVDPPSDIKIVSTPEKIARGEYLAKHVTVCIDCHSDRDFSKYSGPIVLGTEGKGGFKFDKKIGFPGTIYSKNITPFALKDWTDGEILRAITQGVDKDNKALFPIMPYPFFNSLTQEDAESIIAYIRSLTPKKNLIEESELDFPLNFIVKTIPLKTYSPHKPVDRFDSVSYGKYLFTIGGCRGCHTPSDKGEPIPGKELAGGEAFNLPWGIIRSANITPDPETGIGKWSKEQFINTFKSFDSDSAKNIQVASNEFNTIMPWTMFAGMTEEDLSSIYYFLRTVKPVENNVVRFSPAKVSNKLR